MIYTDNLSVSLQGKPILSNISIQIPKGQLTCILGPNGAGKSTLLKCLAGFLSPTEGQITYHNRPLESYSAEELAQSRAVLTQSVSIAFPMTVRDIVELGRTASNPHIDGQFTRDIAEQAMQLTETLAYADRPISSLSGGEQQRVHLARVLTQVWGRKSPVIYLDEPTSALDLKHQFQLLEICRTLCLEKSATVVMVLHDLHLAKRFANMVILLQKGQLFAKGSNNQVLVRDHICPLYEIEESFSPI